MAEILAFRRLLQRRSPMPDVFYVDIPHTASASIRAGLGLEDRPRHEPARKKRRRVDGWKQAFTFSVVRNPYARVGRMYQRRSRLGKHDLSFREWLDLRFLEGRQPIDTAATPLYWEPQRRWLSDTKGHVLVDYVGYFARLRGTWQIIQRALGEDLDLPHKNRLDLPPWEDLYDEWAREIVAEAFSEDFERFGYEKDGLPCG